MQIWKIQQNTEQWEPGAASISLVLPAQETHNLTKDTRAALQQWEGTASNCKITTEPSRSSNQEIYRAVTGRTGALVSSPLTSNPMLFSIIQFTWFSVKITDVSTLPTGRPHTASGAWMGLQGYWERSQSKTVNEHLTMGRISLPLEEQKDMWDRPDREGV